LPFLLNSNNQSIAGYRHREQDGLTVIEQSATIPGNDLSALMMTALKKRGAKASEEHLQQVVSTFILSGATIYDMASSREKKDKRLQESTLNELRLMMTGYLANYLD